MDLPRRFAYDVNYGPIAGLLIVGMGLTVLALVGAGFWLYLPMGVLIGGLGLVIAARRLFSPRVLELENDALLLPTGFFRTRVERIPYDQIESLGEKTLNSLIARIRIFKLFACGRLFEIVSARLRSEAEYEAIGDFLKALPGPKEKQLARESAPVVPGKYCFRCSYEGNGVIFNSRGDALWRTETRHRGRPRYPYGLFRLPDFVVSDPAGREFVTIKRERGFIFSTCVMLENGQPVCRISQRSVLLNQYTLDFDGASKWRFQMRLFTVVFGGTSDTGATVLVRVAGHNTWFVQIDSEADNPRLAVALAFIHRERLRSN